MPEFYTMHLPAILDERLEDGSCDYMLGKMVSLVSLDGSGQRVLARVVKVHIHEDGSAVDLIMEQVPDPRMN